MLDDDGRRQLAMHGIRLGIDMIYMADLLKPAQIEAKALLYSLYHEEFPESGPPPAGRVAIDHIEGVSDAYWLATGYRRLGGRVMRVDMAERLSAVIRAAAREGKFQISEEMLSLAGATREQMVAMILDLHYAQVDEIPLEDPEKPAIPVFERKRRPSPQSRNKPSDQARQKGKRNPKHQGNGKTMAAKPSGRGKPAERQPDPNSPFAVLAQLKAK